MYSLPQRRHLHPRPRQSIKSILAMWEPSTQDFGLGEKKKCLLSYISNKLYY